jgi:hypothetical protein
MEATNAVHQDNYCVRKREVDDGLFAQLFLTGNQPRKNFVLFDRLAAYHDRRSHLSEIGEVRPLDEFGATNQR